MLSTCGKCGGNLFEVQEVSAEGAAFKKYFFQCSSCGVPVGVADYFDTNAMLEKLTKQMDELSGRLDQIEYSVTSIEQKVR